MIAGGGIDRQHRHGAVDVGEFAARNESGPQRVCCVETVRRIALGAVDERAAEDIGRNTVEHNVALRIRPEVHAVVAGKVGKLGVVLQSRTLPCHDADHVAFVLIFIERR